MFGQPAPFQYNAFNSKCPTRVVLDQLADKWTVLVLGALDAGPVRFNALKRRLDGISQKMLGQTLKQLERNGLVDRRAFATVPVTVEYSLTPLGAALTQPVNALREWAEANIAQMLAAQQRFDATKPAETMTKSA
ncbi:MAG: helix-turn-helix domain-containing protein [Terracidiphilus sp.]